VKGASNTRVREVRRGKHLLVKAEVRVAFISESRAQPIPKSMKNRFGPVIGRYAIDHRLRCGRR